MTPILSRHFYRNRVIKSFVAIVSFRSSLIFDIDDSRLSSVTEPSAEFHLLDTCVASCFRVI